MEPKPAREFSSLRDPSGFIFYLEGHVYRALNYDAHSILKELDELGLLAQLMQSSKLVKTEFLNPTDRRVITFKNSFPEHPYVIEHEPIRTLTMPSEWTRSMLCDAALLELELQKRLISAGFMLKDATAYNVQFLNTQPIHIDLPSIEKREGGIWPAYGQFCRMFLFPLLLHQYKRMSLKSYFLTNMSGLELDDVAQIMGISGLVRPANFLDIFLPFMIQRLLQKKEPKSLQKMMEKNVASRAALETNLNRLERLIKSLRSKSQHAYSRWERYTEENLYSPSERTAKKETVHRLLRKTESKIILDLGSNTGEYAILATECADQVVAVEGDHESLDRLYNIAKEKKLAIQTIWMDLLNPTPGMGFRHKERTSFEDRVRGDTVMALALVHHLITASNFPLSEIAKLLFALTNKYLLVEYINPKDPQFESLVGLRANLYLGLTEEVFVNVFSDFGQLIESVRLNNFRTLFLFAKN